ncbi:prolyl aminopeptidase-2 [Hysterangium stoloniferum]|nr:prolyl aminopeptidase-2 [Hysterangium stoloniferum]
MDSQDARFLFLHPGGSHEYLLVFTALVSTHGIPVIFYVQIGSGRSTHLPENQGDGTFWTEERFYIDDYHILGHLWSVMLGANYATSQPKGLDKLIISDSPASMELFDGHNRLTRYGDSGRMDSKDYEAETIVYYKLHVCRLETWPDELDATLNSLAKGSTVYSIMRFSWTIDYKNGPNDSHVIGTRKCKWVQFANSSNTPRWEETTRYLDIVGNFLA